ncbi:MAG: hypothetical protein IT428_26160 [Planctomycetaceae bacterium]|nr:hypothetical protein [Planctomycetaceae bacterium]
MSTETLSTFTPAQRSSLEDAIRLATHRGVDREEMRKAAESMDRIREDIRKKHGTLDIGVPAIRDLRDA